MYTRLDANYFKGGEWTMTPHFGYKICKGSSLIGDITFDGVKRELSSLNLGVTLKPNKKMCTLVSRQYNGQIGKGTDFLWSGLLCIRSRLSPKDHTYLGYDYVYNFDTKTSAMEVGVESRVHDDLTLKGRVNSGGEIETSAKLKISDNWNFIGSIATNAADVAGKQQPLIGFGFEGKL